MYSTNWIEWYVRKEPILNNMLHPSGEFSWNLFDDTGSGTVTLYDSTRDCYSILSSRGWFVKFPGDLKFWFYQKGSWSARRPLEIANGTRTFEVCQKFVNNCNNGGNQKGCCGPYGSKRCCDFNTNRCGPC